MAAPAAEPPASVATVERNDGPWQVTGLVAAAVLIAGSLAAGIAAIVPSRSLATGIADAGPSVELTLPALKAIFDMAAAATVGWLVAAVALVPPADDRGRFTVSGYRCIRAASISAWVWAAAALALIPVSLADLGPYPLTTALRSDYVLSGLQASESLRGYLVAAVLAVLIGLVARVVLRVRWATWLLAAAILGLMPLAIGGHASVNGDHDIAVDTMIYHLVGISIWIGGLIAFLGLAKQRADHLPVIARRYSTTAGVAFAVVALSGIINAWIRLTYVSDLWTTPYGRLVVVKGVALIALGLIGFAHRQRTLPALNSGRRGPLLRLAGVEVLLMGLTVGVAAGLARTAPPAPSGIIQSVFDANLTDTLGFTLAGPPTAVRLLFDWRFDFLLGTAALVAVGLYLTGVRRLRRRGDSWPPGRIVAWCGGCLTILLATSSGLGRYAQSQFSIHMIAHMMLGMVAPILLVLGGPVTLLLRALPARKDGGPGLREAVVAVVHGPIARFLTHPLVVLPLFIGSFYAIYFSGLFEDMMTSHVGHLLMSVHFLVVGYLYYWVIIGIDPAPRRLSPFVKLALLLAALPFHAFFGLALMNAHTILAQTYYQGLALPWVPDLLADQHLGGGIAWGLTEVPMIIVLLALLAQWAKADDRESRRSDRQQDAGRDSDLDAYNRMLAKLAERAD